jgi:hypothetical protein
VVVDARLISFRLIEIDGQRYDYDVVLEQGVIGKRKKGPSKVHRERYGHTPLSIKEAIPWSGSVLIIGTGASGRLPVMPELYVSKMLGHAGLSTTADLYAHLTPQTQRRAAERMDRILAG